MNSGKVLLEAQGLRVAAGPRTLIESLDLQVRGGELWCVMGSNGSGKTTLLHTLAGLRPAQAGTVSIKGKPLAEWPPGELARLRGLLPQTQHDAFSAAALAREPAQVIEHRHLVVQVEVRHRLVEQQQRRVLRQQRGDAHALPLAAGQRGHCLLYTSPSPRD